jgi:Flp pilus assembly protein TadG
VSFGPKGAAKSSENAVDTVDAAAAASATALAQARRRQRAKSKARIGGQRYEYLEETAGMGATVGHSAETVERAATSRGAGPLGFAGTVRAATDTHSARTVRLASDDTRQVAPMLPSTWEIEDTERS